MSFEAATLLTALACALVAGYLAGANHLAALPVAAVRWARRRPVCDCTERGAPVGTLTAIDCACAGPDCRCHSNRAARRSWIGPEPEPAQLAHGRSA